LLKPVGSEALTQDSIENDRHARAHDVGLTSEAETIRDLSVKVGSKNAVSFTYRTAASADSNVMAVYTILLPLAPSHDDLPALQIDVLHTKSQTFLEP
jgi:hypothetical protein